MRTIVRTYYAIQFGDRIYWDRFKTIERAKEEAQKIVTRMTGKEVRILEVKEELTPVETIKPTPLYKMF